ncbi:MAG: DNA gyrase subunit A [Deltaproteobacteria bacterium]|nr:DNA gyrase subunit A [Deltaproteobacteria bacterium]
MADSDKLGINIEDEMQKSYLDYSMSVIVGRALPDVRDGLKPVHRRVLFAMNELGNDYNKPYKKSARVVGDVIGKYHPHGDSAVYDTIVRLAQPFSMRYPLVDGQGNFGSVDGDAPAAMRYTEVRMARLAHEVLADLDKETVDFGPNYDDSLQEPLVLPCRFPNLLVNGSEGIAVGMMTKIPPHNLGEVIDALTAMIDDPELADERLLQLVPGPDFPTGGIILGHEGIRQAYQTGRGVICIRARALVEREKKGNRDRIVVTEIPYQVNKAKLIERIAELVKDKKIDGISDLRDESDRDGMRIAIDLKKDAYADVVLNQLYKMTSMQASYGIIMLALVNGEPKILPLRTVLYHFLEHRKEVVVRRGIFELRKAEARAHILEGFKIALDHLDEVIRIIRESSDPGEAKVTLMDRFALSDIQAQEILNMRLQRLTGLEREKILTELREVTALIARLKEILSSEAEIFKIVKTELLEIRSRYADPRRTEIVDAQAEFSLEDLIVEEDMAVTVTHSGYIKRSPVSLYRAQRRGGKGKTGMRPREEDFVEQLFIASTHSYILVFTDKGRLYWLKVHEVPEGGSASRGKAIVNLIQVEAGEKVNSILPVKEFREGQYIVTVTANGIIKKTDLMAYSNPRSSGIIALEVEEGDRLVSSRLTDGSYDIILASENGMSIRFSEKDVRPTGRATRGVRGMTLVENDRVIGMEVVSENTVGYLVSVTRNGYGKRTRIGEYRLQSRGGKGLITIKTSERNGPVVDIKMTGEDEDLMLVTSQGKILRTRVGDLSVIGRNTQGVRLMNMDAGEVVVAVAKLAEKDDDDETDDADGRLFDDAEAETEENGGEEDEENGADGEPEP